MGVSISLSEVEKYYIAVQHNDWLSPPTNLVIPPDFFKNVTVPIAMHHAFFDIQVTDRLGCPLPKDYTYCTLIMDHYIDENRWPSFELEVVAKDRLGVAKEADLKHAMKDQWDNTPDFVMAKYAEQDADLHRRLYNQMIPEFAQYKPLWESVDRDVLYILLEASAKGMLINRDLTKELLDRCLVRMDQIKRELGFDPTKENELHPKLFGSPPDGLGLKPASYTPKTSKPQVNTKFLERCNHPIAGLLLEYRGLAKESSSYFRPYLRLSSRDSRLHPTYKMHGTVTGRLSGENPNPQQIPREGQSKVKQIFLPEDGKQLWELDYDGLEYRVGAIYCGNQRMLDAFKGGHDFHQAVADDLGITRHAGKTLNFSIVNGGGPGLIAGMLGISEKNATIIHDAYFDNYPEMRRAMNEAQDVAEAMGEIRYWSGRRRHFKHESEYRKAWNSILQGGGFEIVKQGMVNARKAGADIRNQVHDSVWVNVDNRNEAEELAHEMSDWTEEAFGLPFTVSIKRLN